MCFDLAVDGRAWKSRAVVSSGVSLYRKFDISTTVTAVAVALSAADADGTAIITGVTERGENIKASPKG